MSNDLKRCLVMVVPLQGDERRKMIVRVIQGLRNNTLSLDELKEVAQDSLTSDEVMQVVREIVRDDMLIWRVFKSQPEWNIWFYRMLYWALEAHAGKSTFPILVGALDDMEKVTPPCAQAQAWIDWWCDAYQWLALDETSAEKEAEYLNTPIEVLNQKYLAETK